MKLSIIQIHVLNEECIFKKDNPIFPIKNNNNNKQNVHKTVDSMWVVVGIIHMVGDG